jgi:hypothetical protein
MAANSPENPVPMITVSEYRGCLGLLANAGLSSVAGCADALIVDNQSTCDSAAPNPRAGSQGRSGAESAIK